MENGFNFEMYEIIFRNCFIERSTYKNGNLQLSMYGLDPEVNQISHFADITLEQNSIPLRKNEIIVNNHFRPTLIPQLKNLGILKKKLGMCMIHNTLYPIYTVNQVGEKVNCLPLMSAA